MTGPRERRLLPLLPIAWFAASGWFAFFGDTSDPWGTLAVGLVMGVLMCFFLWPQKTVRPVAEAGARLARAQSGHLNLEDIRWYVTRYLPRQPTAPQTDRFEMQLIAWVRIRSAEPGGTAAHAKTIVRWFRTGEDLVLLRNALLIDTPVEALRAHLDGTDPLDPEATALLAGLSS